MQNAADSGVSAVPKHHSESLRSIASELAALLDHVQASIKVLETTIVHDGSSEHPEHVGNVVILDDVSPRYAKASAALSACNNSLDAALRFLRDAETSAPLTKSTPRLLRLPGHR
jgi:hypothetical protein